MMKKSVLVMMAAAALASCSESNLNDAPAIDNGEIKVRSVAYDVTTRAPYEGNDLAANPLTARVLTAKDDAFATTYSDGTMVFDSKDAVQYLELNSGVRTYPTGDVLHIFGLHPADVTNWAGSGTDYTYTFSGKEDVMGAKMVEYADQSKAETLQFKHLLTRLDVKLKADAAALDIFGEVLEISLSGDNAGAPVCNTITFNATDATATLGAKDAAINFWSMSADAEGKKSYSNDEFENYILPTSATGEYCAYAMVAPVETNVNAGEVIYYLAVETEKEGTKYVGVKLEKALTAGSSTGYAYDVTIHFKASNQIEAIASVTPWKDGGNASGEINDK